MRLRSSARLRRSSLAVELVGMSEFWDAAAHITAAGIGGPASVLAVKAGYVGSVQASPSTYSVLGLSYSSLHARTRHPARILCKNENPKKRGRRKDRSLQLRFPSEFSRPASALMIISANRLLFDRRRSCSD
jgi:hypothetical protein